LNLILKNRHNLFLKKCKDFNKKPNLQVPIQRKNKKNRQHNFDFQPKQNAKLFKGNNYEGLYVGEFFSFFGKYTATEA